MTDSQDKNNNQSSPSKDLTSKETKKEVTAFDCVTGGLISGGLGVASYFLTKSVIGTYATMPIKFNNAIAVNIASMVRTLIMGITTMATFLFGMITLGLFALAIKLLIQRKRIAK